MSLGVWWLTMELMDYLTIGQTHDRHLKQLQQLNLSVNRSLSTTEMCTNWKSFILFWDNDPQSTVDCETPQQLTMKLWFIMVWLWLCRFSLGCLSCWTKGNPPPPTHLKDIHTHINTSQPPPYMRCILFGISELVMTSAHYRKLDLSWYAKANAKQTSHRHTRARLFLIISP